MDSLLKSNAYGKNAIKLSKIVRHAGRHEIRHISVDISLQGDFETAHTLGDNTSILPTDTMKNTVYALAKDHFNESIESFGCCLTEHFLSRNPQIGQTSIRLTEYCWQRLSFGQQPHPHAFVNGGSEKHTTHITADRQALRTSSGIRDLLLLKTTDSAFEHYIKDEYTTLKPAADRIFSTECEIEWKYIPGASVDYDQTYEAIRLDLLHSFAHHKSLSVQHTLYAMGDHVLTAFANVSEISLKMPNKHHILFNLEPFGMTNQNEIFIATDEPYGYITGTITRHS